MAEELAKKESFEEKMMNRIRDSIGDLMSDEDLKKIVAAGVEKAMFTGRRIPRQWGADEIADSVVDTSVKKFLQERMAKAVDEWLVEHPDALQKAIDAAVKAGVAGCVDATINAKFGHVFMELQRLSLPPAQR